MKKKEQAKLKKGCFSCWHMQYESPCHEYPADGNYFYCEKRDDEPEENMKTWPAERKLKCFEPLPQYYIIENWRID